MTLNDKDKKWIKEQLKSTKGLLSTDKSFAVKNMFSSNKLMTNPILKSANDLTKTPKELTKDINVLDKNVNKLHFSVGKIFNKTKLIDKNLDKINKELAKNSKAISTGSSLSIGSKVKQVIDNIGKGIGKGIGNITNNITRKFTNVISSIKSRISTFLQKLSPKYCISQISKGLKNLLLNNPLIKGIKGVLSGVKNIVGGLFKGVGNLFGLGKPQTINTQSFQQSNVLSKVTNNTFTTAKEARINGGQNLILVSQIKKQKQEQEEKKHNSTITNLLSGIHKHGEKISKDLGIMKLFNMLKLGGILGTAGSILLGIGGITAGLLWLREKGIPEIIKKFPDFAKKILQGITNILHKSADKVEDDMMGGVRKKEDVIIDQHFQNIEDTTGIRQYTDKLYSGNTELTSIIDANKDDKGNNLFWHGDKIKNLKANKLIDKATNRLLEDPKHNWANFNANVKNFKTQSEGKKISFPVAIKILDAEFNEDGTSSVLIERAETGFGLGKTSDESWKNESKYNLLQSPRLVITRVIKFLVPRRVVIPRNTHFVIVDKTYQIIGDLAAFMNHQNYSDYQNSEETNKLAGYNWENFMSSEEMSEAYRKSRDHFESKESFKQITVKTGKDLLLKPIDMVNDYVQNGIAADYNPTAISSESVNSEIAMKQATQAKPNNNTKLNDENNKKSQTNIYNINPNNDNSAIPPNYGPQSNDAGARNSELTDISQ